MLQSTTGAAAPLSLSYLICAANSQTICHKLQGNAIKENCTATARELTCEIRTALGPWTSDGWLLQHSVSGNNLPIISGKWETMKWMQCNRQPDSEWSSRAARFYGCNSLSGSKWGTENGRAMPRTINITHGRTKCVSSAECKLRFIFLVPLECSRLGNRGVKTAAKWSSSREVEFLDYQMLITQPKEMRGKCRYSISKAKIF